MEILSFIDFIKTTTITGRSRSNWPVAELDQELPSIVISDYASNDDIEGEDNCVSNDSGICADLCYSKCDGLLDFLRGKEVEWELIRKRLR